MCKLVKMNIITLLPAKLFTLHSSLIFTYDHYKTTANIPIHTNIKVLLLQYMLLPLIDIIM